MENTNLKPSVRFPEFKDNWKTKRTGEIAPLQRGFDLPTREVIEGDFPVVYSNGILRKHNTFKVESPGVVTGRSGTIGKVSYVEEDFWPHNTSLWVTDFKNNDPKFIYYFYSIFNLERFSGGSTVPTLNRNDVHFVKKNIPSSKDEQQKIADFLTSIDSRITLLKEKKDTLLDFKKGVLQKIFNQDIRFKDDNGNDFPDWEEKILGEIGTTLNGLTGKTKEDFGDGKPFVQYTQIFNSSKLNTNDFGFVNITSEDNQTKLNFGDILFTTSSETPHEVGMSSVLLEEIDELYLNSFSFGFRPNDLKKLVPSFAQYLFRSNNVRRNIIKLAQGSTRYNMSKLAFMKQTILLPVEDEQTKIANYLTTLDDKIDALQQKIETSIDFKKGLLQKMFV